MPNPNNNGVVITVYVESPSTNIRPLSESNPSKKVKRNPVSRKCQRSQGYDRRAELLAYSQELRGGDNNEELEWNNEKSSKHRSKKWKCPTTARKLGNSFLGILRKTKGRWKYQRMSSESEDYKRNDNTGKKKKHRRRIFWRKLKRMLRGLAHFWQRKKR